VGFFSTRVAFVAGDLPGLDILTKLQPGKYFLELRVHAHFLCGRPWDFLQIEHERAVREAERSLGPNVKVENHRRQRCAPARDDRPTYSRMDPYLSPARNLPLQTASSSKSSPATGD